MLGNYQSTINMYQTDKSPATPPVALHPAGSAADEDAELVAFEWFAMAHPHEAYETYPERFWLFFQTKCPGKTRAEMEKILADTAEPPNAGAMPRAVNNPKI